ncbi:hypothetical protein MMC09_000615 [Bachmanniomyces sp. S44760]|nr:hypothetical protein [Bachmanniomyces sp. S44760]
MSLGRKKLVDIRSSTFQAVMNIMKPLETGGNIHVTCAEAGQLTIELPRYKIEFSLNSEGYLESPELGAIVDPDQSLDTWLGLESKLILRSFSNLTGLSKRSVVIPFGVASCHRVNNHVQVSIVPQSAAKIGYFRYQVDSALRRLNAPSDLRARLFKAYLHALTSHILPDPLTGRTGTEEALCCLREQSLRTCAVLSADVVDLLNRIAGLTPSRHFYPKHLRCMQQTKWKSKLSSLSQHDDFLVLAREIAAHSERFLILQEGTCGKFELKSRGDDFLLDRARLRHANFRSPLFGGNDGPPQGDTIYKGRDREIASAQGDRVFQVTSMIRDWPSNMKVPVNVSSMVLQWAAVAGYQRSFEWKSYSELLGSHFPDEWGALYNLCRRSGRDHDMYKLSFIFSGIAYRQSDCLDQIKVLLAFAFLPAFRHFKAPDFDNYALSVGMKPDESKIVGSIKRNWREYEARLHGTKVQYQSEATKQANAVRKHLMMNWPCNQPQMPNSSAVSLIDIAAISKEFKSHFHECYKNLRFSEHLGEVDNHLAAAQEGYLIKLPNAGDGLLPFVVGSSLDRIPIAPSLADLLQTQGPTLPRPVAKLTAKRVTVPSSCNSDNAELKSIVDQLCATTDPTRNRYANSLKSSLDALENASESKANSTLPLQLRQLVAYRTICESNLKNLLDAVRNSLVPATAVQQVVSDAGLWPRVTTAALLQLISSRSCVHIDPSWRRKILCLGEAITTTQRSERMLICAARDDILEFYKEAENVGHQDWPIEKYPDWLLIEIENNFLIRPIQARVACEMISPSSQENSVMQLNMGEGKSSVIIPMIITALADADQLVRVVVLKSLAKQMGYSLTQCLGGLVGRRLYQMPFSRKTPISIPMLDKLQTIYKECRLEQGVLLAQPEHILSFKLMGIERLSSAQSPIASTLMNIQEWLQRHCRDVLDESDELLAVHWQLIYTIGSQQHMDGQPDRWIMTQQIFSRIEKHASFLHEIDPDSVECEKRSSERFPALRILKPDLVGRLLDLLVSDIENGRLSGITLANCSQRQRDTALRFVKDQHISQPDHDFVITSFAEGSYLKPLLLLRGLIGFRIILFVLQSKRWLVNYGLDLTRCLMAVPYRAKGVPSPSAEFGHPDVAICLTCLSYYYTGLTETNLRDCFRLLFRMTDPTLEYHKWVSRCEALSPDLQTINSVNLEDDGLCRERLFPHLRFNKAVVDFYLANFVFPKEAKEFPEKLSSSGWDIPSESKHLPTTGFSGTNDNQYLLPLSMVQHDLDELKHTTAMVLGYILRPENREYAFTRDGRGQKLQLLDLLDLLPKQSPRVTVLIDAGAQILEMGNQDVAIRWLELDPDAKAVVFLNQDDEKMIVDRDSNVEPLATSSFSDRMNECLIYLDEVHTRGTDLSIAVGTRAAVTLGPKLTKDKLV